MAVMTVNDIRTPGLMKAKPQGRLLVEHIHGKIINMTCSSMPGGVLGLVLFRICIDASFFSKPWRICQVDIHAFQDVMPERNILCPFFGSIIHFNGKTCFKPFKPKPFRLKKPVAGKHYRNFETFPGKGLAEPPDHVLNPAGAGYACIFPGKHKNFSYINHI